MKLQSFDIKNLFIILTISDEINKIIIFSFFLFLSLFYFFFLFCPRCTSSPVISTKFGCKREQHFFKSPSPSFSHTLSQPQHLRSEGRERVRERVREVGTREKAEKKKESACVRERHFKEKWWFWFYCYSLCWYLILIPSLLKEENHLKTKED